MRKTCDEVLERLYEYLNRNDLTEADRSEIRRHLDDCRPCGEAYDFEEKLLQRLRRDCVEKCPESLRARVRSLLGLM